MVEKITSRRNPLCVHMKKLGADRAYREKCGEYFCDGIKLLEEAVGSEAEVTAVIAASPIPFPLSVDTRVYYAERGLVASLSPLKTAQDIVFTCRIKPQPETSDKQMPPGTYILLDGVQDPGNVGAVIRTANAFGIAGVLLTGACADPYNSKTVRASMGAVFRQRIMHCDLAALTEMKENGARFIGAVPAGESLNISDISLSGAVIAVGNESRGLSENVARLCSEKVRIPISPECESLGAAVAAAIIMYESTRNNNTAGARIARPPENQGI